MSQHYETFEYCFGPESTQMHVFTHLKKIDKCLRAQAATSLNAYSLDTTCWFIKVEPYNRKKKQQCRFRDVSRLCELRGIYSVNLPM